MQAQRYLQAGSQSSAREVEQVCSLLVRRIREILQVPLLEGPNSPIAIRLCTFSTGMNTKPESPDDSRLALASDVKRTASAGRVTGGMNGPVLSSAILPFTHPRCIDIPFCRMSP